MINKQLLGVAISASVLGGCVSDSDLAQVNAQVSQLQTQVASLKGQLAQSNETLVATQGELDVVKKQRVVRLPTGAPLEMRARNEDVPEAPSSAEEEAFKQALQQYKAGDTEGGATALEGFLSNYPNSSHSGEASYYLAQAAYTTRDFNRAQQILEPLVLQPTNGQVNQSMARLLDQVYQAQGNSEDAAKLAEYLQSLSQPQAMTPAVETAEPADSPQPLRPTIAD